MYLYITLKIIASLNFILFKQKRMCLSNEELNVSLNLFYFNRLKDEHVLQFTYYI